MNKEVVSIVGKYIKSKYRLALEEQELIDLICLIQQAPIDILVKKYFELVGDSTVRLSETERKNVQDQLIVKDPDYLIHAVTLNKEVARNKAGAEIAHTPTLRVRTSARLQNALFKSITGISRSRFYSCNTELKI
jgi:hypothetical protein